MTETRETPGAPAPSPPTAPGPTDYMARAIAALGANDPPPETSAPAVEEAPPPPAPAPVETPAVETAPAISQEEFAGLFAERTQFERERAQFEAQQAQMKPAIQALERIRGAKGADVVDALREVGLEYSELTRRILENPDAAKPGALDAAAELRKDFEALKKTLEDDRAADKREVYMAQASTGIEREMRADVDSERWELLLEEPESGRQVIEYIERTWQAYGSKRDERGQPVMPLTWEQAADSLEKYLVGQVTRYSESNKVRRHFAPGEPATERVPPAAPPATPGADARQATVPVAATLSTTHASSASRSDNIADPEACRARAMAVLDRMKTG